MQRRNLEEVVTEFRSALQELAASGFHFNVSIDKDFPHAACDDSSLLLAAYLSDQGFPGAVRVHGEWGGRDNELVTHVWLKLDGTLIDITGSQFENYSQPEILIAEHDDFLDTFEVEAEGRIADYRQTPELPRYDFNQAYDAIRARVPG
ncbi:hypothetical protein MO767_20255 [Pseudomonas sp. UYIF39]|uniref:hypothetical protein n=1 Tax=Pseudomonas sp. UYIF39 TaxID=1630747 RepID=UPI00249DF4BA|nr:hypothetical protein [Pseudomonas sp. UYIF39]MDI3356661.1 hypothetical protein [Pseudomonas sp. UYIF39]